MGLKSTKLVTVKIGPMQYLSGVWPGGAYVDLSFNGLGPVEVINIYDYATGTYDSRAMSPAGLRAILREWADDQDSEWPEWFDGYLQNA